jgi:hypothetical protein
VLENWKRFHWQMAEEPTLVISGVRKIVGDVQFEIPGSCLHTDLDFTDLGFRGKNKFNQLKRTYWNQESVDSAVEKLLSRKGSPHASAAVRLQAGDKDSRSSGYCMQNMVITVTKDRSFIDLHYRSTEVSLKFLADLIFFSRMLPPVFDQLGIQPEVIRFKFANAFISALFQPIFLRWEEDPVGFYKHLKKHDPRFFRTYGLASSKYSLKEHNYTFRSRILMFEYVKAHIPQKKLDSLLPLIGNLKGELKDDEDEE